jgi:3-dehydroquinate dehydratase-1
MNTLTIRGLTIGEGRTKICVPLVSSNPETLMQEAKKAVDEKADLAEWRVDYFNSQSTDVLLHTLALLRRTCENLPLIVTFRTKREGGERDINPDEYYDLLSRIIKTKHADFIDIEFFIGDSIVSDLITQAQEHSVKTIISNHDFHSTPPKEELLSRLCQMQRLGADLPKIAVMPQTPQDVLTLLSATEEMMSKYADRPFITMSMSSMGAISRICGHIFGSAVTFASLAQASAPGQISIKNMQTIQSILC